MGQRDGTVTGQGTVAQPPCKPPLEMIEVGGEWHLREFRRTERQPTVVSTHGSRIDAMRAAQDTMTDERYPCLLRWDARDVVGDIYWNKTFERLRLEHSTLLDAWVVVPDGDSFVFDSAASAEQAYEVAKAVQRQYDFKELAVCTHDGDVKKVVEHRFLRNAIAESGVRFKRDRPLGRVDDALGSEETTADADNGEIASMTTTSTLMAAIPDLTELETVATTGYVHHYRGTWTDGEQARIALLDPDRDASSAGARQFVHAVDDWRELCDDDRVTTVYEVGISPSAWVAYRAGEGTLGRYLGTLSRTSQLQILADVATAIDLAIEAEVFSTAINPETVQLTSRDEPARASLAGWGIERAVRAAVGDATVTPYTAPEQLAGKVAPSTPVYQLGALAYHLLCGRRPYETAENRRRAIRTGSFRQPSVIASVPTAFDDVLGRAMAPTPDQRYDSATTLYQELAEILP